METMKRTLKKYFIPHEGNDHKPHILREGATTFMLAGILCLEAAFLVGALFLYPRLDFLAAILPSVLVEETNLSRQTENLAPLKTNSLLELAAEAKANDMAQKSYFSHITPDGRTPWSFLQDVKYSFVAAGENLAVNFFDSKDVAQAWMDSPGHRANIMNKNFKEIGIATAHGFYQGRDAIFVVQFFGTPAKAAAPPLAPEKLKVTPKVAEASSQSNVKEETFVAVQNESAEEEISLSPVPAASDDGDYPFMREGTQKGEDRFQSAIGVGVIDENVKVLPFRYGFQIEPYRTFICLKIFQNIIFANHSLIAQGYKLGKAQVISFAPVKEA